MSLQLNSLVRVVPGDSPFASETLVRLQLGTESCHASLEKLKHNSTVKSLIVHGDFQLSEVSAAAIGDILACNSTLTSLDLTYTRARETLGIVIGQALRVNTTLTELKLKGIGFPGDPFTKLAIALGHNRTLKSLRMCGDSRSKEGFAAAVGEMLTMNSTLTSLNLDYCNGEDVLGVAIGKALRVNTTLTSLSLELNKLGELSGVEIGEGLRLNSTLLELNLWHNDFAEDAVTSIAEALKVNNTLTILNVDSNSIGEVGVKKMEEIFMCNSTLKLLKASIPGYVESAGIKEGSDRNQYNEKKRMVTLLGLCLSSLASPSLSSRVSVSKNSFAATI